MNIALAAGGAATIIGLVGYLVGVTASYPGRAFSLTLLMFGMALTLAGRAGADEAA